MSEMKKKKKKKKKRKKEKKKKKKIGGHHLCFKDKACGKLPWSILKNWRTLFSMVYRGLKLKLSKASQQRQTVLVTYFVEVGLLRK